MGRIPLLRLVFPILALGALIAALLYPRQVDQVHANSLGAPRATTVSSNRPTNNGHKTSTSTSTPTRTSTSTASTPTGTATATASPDSTNCPCSLWSSGQTPATADTSDGKAVELGVKFQADTNGFISGIRFYKGPTNTGTHVGNLWTSSGQLLASATFSNETSSGWQQVSFATPVAVSANTTYVASYHTNVGHYAVNEAYFASTSVDNPPLHAMISGTSGGNGVYLYSAASAFPSQTYNADDYWVDVVFTTSTSSTSPTPTAVTSATPTGTATPASSATASATPTRTATPASSATASATPTRTATPASSATATPTLTPTAISSPTATTTPTTTPLPGAITNPIVFVSRQIPPDGSKSFTPPDGTNSYPGVGDWSRFVSAGPGKLQILQTNGTVTTLLDGTHPDSVYGLIDFNAPDVSYDGTKIVFAGFVPTTSNASNSQYANQPKANPGGWRIYTIRPDGSGLTAITNSAYTIDTSKFTFVWSPTDYDDTDPIWLPDGRIAFASTRYPETAEYEGARSSDLFVVNADGTNLHRITSEKGGADRPLVDPVTGQIVFSRWWRNNHFGTNNMSTILCSPGVGDCTQNGYEYKDGLTIDRGDASDGVPDDLDTNGWQEDAINPDGTGLHAFNISERNSRDSNVGYGGTFLRDGRLITNFFMPANLAEEAGFGGLRLLVRGFQSYACIIGICSEQNQTLVSGAGSDIFVSKNGYAAEAAQLSNGQIVVARAFDIQQDYGLWVMNTDGSNPQLLYDNPGTTETRPVILASRALPPIIPDKITTTAPMTPPPVGGPYNQDGTFTFQDLNVYFNAPVDTNIPNAAPIGSLSTLTFFADPQQGSANASVPETSWPVKLATASVSSQGAVLNTNAPADMPLFEQGRDANGKIVATIDPESGSVNGATHVAGQNYGRPGEVMQCVGCHAGHSVLQVPANPAFSNLATGATVTASSIDTNPDQNGAKPTLASINNRLVVKEPFNHYWRSTAGQVQGQWVQLTFPVPIVVSDVRLYNPVAGSDQYGDRDNIQVQGATVTLYSDAAATQQVATSNVGPLTTTPGQGTDVNFNNVTVRAVRVTVNSVTGTYDGSPAASLSEVEVIASGS